MKAELHSVDNEKPKSEGQTLYLEGPIKTVAVKRRASLTFGDDTEQFYLEFHASGRDGGTHSELTAELEIGELQKIFDAVRKEGLLETDPPVNQRALDLLRQLHEELSR